MTSPETVDQVPAPGLVDTLQAEAAGAIPSAPVGAPALVPFHQLDRRKRAAVTKVVAELMPKVEKYVDAPAPSGSLTEGQSLGFLAEALEWVADIEDFLLVVAVDRERMTQWVKSADDAALLGLFMSFTARLGEAGSSSS